MRAFLFFSHRSVQLGDGGPFNGDLKFGFSGEQDIVLALFLSLCHTFFFLHILLSAKVVFAKLIVSAKICNTATISSSYSLVFLFRFSCEVLSEKLRYLSLTDF